jgi:hypothetical protein
MGMVVEGALFLAQLGVADDAADLQHDQIRQQQVQLRLQQNEREIARMDQLRGVLASQEVMAGVKNISSASGTIRAITEHNIQEYLKDDTADKLNFMAKRQALNIEDRQVDVRKRAQYLQATAGFMKQVEDAGAAAAGAGGGGGGGGYGASGGSLFDASSNMNLNR